MFRRKGVFSFHPIFRECPLASALPAPEQTCDLLAGWKLDSFVLNRCRHEIPFAYERPLCAKSGPSLTIIIDVRNIFGLATKEPSHPSMMATSRATISPVPPDSGHRRPARHVRKVPVGDVKLSYTITSPDRRLGHGSLFITSPRSAPGALQSRFQ